MTAKERYQAWLEKLDRKDSLYRELLGIAEDNNEIEERFHQDLTFGTAGLRGKIGAGTNRMNFYTVGKATQGVADFITGVNNELRYIMSCTGFGSVSEIDGSCLMMMGFGV